MRDLVIVVDDDQSMLNAIQREIRPWAELRKLQIKTCTSGAAALTHLDKHKARVCLIITDLRMPGMNGKELVEKVHETLPLIPCLVLSGYSDTTEVIATGKSGIYSYILKPWHPGHLVSELDRSYTLSVLQEELETNRLQMFAGASLSVQLRGLLDRKTEKGGGAMHVQGLHISRQSVDATATFSSSHVGTCGHEIFMLGHINGPDLLQGLLRLVIVERFKASCETAKFDSLSAEEMVASFMAANNELLSTVPETRLAVAFCLYDASSNELRIASSGQHFIFTSGNQENVGLRDRFPNKKNAPTAIHASGPIQPGAGEATFLFWGPILWQSSDKASMLVGEIGESISGGKSAGYGLPATAERIRQWIDASGGNTEALFFEIRIHNP